MAADSGTTSSRSTSPLIHVPLFVRPPGGAGAGTADPRLGQLVDLFPTILRVSGVAPPAAGGEAFDLLADPAETRREVLASYAYPRQALSMIGAADVEAHRQTLAPYLRSLRSLRADGKKLIVGSDGRPHLFDLRDDPRETRDLAADEPGLVAEYRARLDAAFGRVAADPDWPRAALGPQDGPGGSDAERDAALRALGYVE